MQIELPPQPQAPLDREQVEKLVREIAEKALELQVERTELDAAITAARKDRDKRIAALGEMIAEREAQVKAWALANREAEFDGQSLVLRHGTLSFRKSGWAVGLVKGWTTEKVIEQLKKLKLRKWIRTKPEIDRQKLLRDRENVDEKELKQAGLEFYRGESFSVEPNLISVLPLKQAA